MNQPQITTNIVEHFEVLGVCPATNLKALYAVPSDKQKGYFRLECQDVDFVATVKVTEKWYSGNDGLQIQPTRVVQAVNRVVGLDLSEGYFTVCDEASNFIGLIREGQDITDLYIPSDFPLETSNQ